MRALVVSLVWASLVSADDLTVGFAEVDVTPPLDSGRPVYIAGFGYNRKATRLHDPIMARAIVLHDGTRKIGLVCADVVGLFHDVAETVRRQVEGFTYVCVSSTHNHEGPDTLGLWGKSPLESGLDPAYMEQLTKGLVKALRDADQARRPVAKTIIGTIRAPELLVDSREPYVKHDDLVVLRFDNAEGKPIGLLVQWNNHPEQMDSKNTELSSDFVGVTVAELKKRFACPVTYLTGTVGGLMTSLDLPLKNERGEELRDGTWEKNDLYGRLVAEAAIKALAAGEPIRLTPFEARSRITYVPVTNANFKLAWRAGVLKRTFYRWENDPHPAKAVESEDLNQPGALRSEVGYLKLGELEVAVIPGEIYPELVLGKVQDPPDPGADFPDAPVEPSIYAQLKSKHKMIIGLGNDEIGYIIPKRQWDVKAPFCYGRTKSQYGEINSVGPDAAPILCKAFADLVRGR